MVHSFNILAFERNTSYPKKGAYILISEELIESHVKEINGLRDQMMSSHRPILTKFNQVANSKGTFYYQTEEEQFYGAKSPISILVDEIIPPQSKKDDFLVKCYLNMIVWPDDVDVEDRFIYVNANEAQVVVPVMCSNDWHLTDTPTSTKNEYYCPVIVNDVPLYRTYTKIADADQSLHTFVNEFGLKEFSKLAILNLGDNRKFIAKSEADTEIQNSRDAIINDDVEETKHALDVDGKESMKQDMYEEIFQSHPLARFTEAMFTHVLQAMAVHKINLTPEFIDDLSIRFKDMTSTSDISIDFTDTTLPDNND